MSDVREALKNLSDDAASLVQMLRNREQWPDANIETAIQDVEEWIGEARQALCTTTADVTLRGALEKAAQICFEYGEQKALKGNMERAEAAKRCAGLIMEYGHAALSI